MTRLQKPIQVGRAAAKLVMAIDEGIISQSQAEDSARLHWGLDSDDADDVIRRIRKHVEEMREEILQVRDLRM
jgi:hypothetical protein